MRLSKTEREAVRAKFGGRCAYCGCILGEKWHADHFQPVVRQLAWESGKGFKPTGECLHPDRNSIANLFPACAPCNIDKGPNSLEWWRGKLQNAVDVLARNNPTFRHALRFGLIEETNARVSFYFERVTHGQGASNLKG